MRNQRLQGRITAGRFTLPIVIFTCIACWVLTSVLLPGLEVKESSYPLWNIVNIPAWANRIVSFLLFAGIGYFLIELNNTFAIIRMRASVQTSLYFLLITACPGMHLLYAGDVAAVTFLISLYFLFKSYQQPRPAGYLFHSFALLSAGSVVETGWVSRCKAVLHAYLGGQAGAGAIMDVLTGRVNPSGKLAETLPLTYEDTPAARYFPGKQQNVEYREGLYIGYRYYETAHVPVRYPFGYGLSYTTFAYSDLKADADKVTFTITNTGSRAGAEIAQLYVAKADAAVFRPEKELKGFAKVFLQAGECKTVTIPLDDKAFRYWNVKTDRWETEGGSYQLLVGASVQDIRLRAEVPVQGTGAPDPYVGKAVQCYRTADIKNVPDAAFEALLGHAIPEDKPHIDQTMTLGELNHSRSPLCWLAWAVLHTLLKRSSREGTPDLNLLFQYNMPVRALAQMTGGMVGQETVDGIVMEAKGFWIIGLLRALIGFGQNAVSNRKFRAALDAERGGPAV